MFYQYKSKFSHGATKPTEKTVFFLSLSLVPRGRHDNFVKCKTSKGKNNMLMEPLTQKIIGCAIEVHKELGPGLLEGVYQSAMGVELASSGLRFETQHRLPVTYKGHAIGEYRIDILVENAVVLELKSVERHDPVFEAQILSYLKLGGYKIGLLINFNTRLVTNGIRRFVL